MARRRNLADGVSERTPAMIANLRDSIERTRALLVHVHAKRRDSTPPDAA
jgi:hypothetical protein